MYTNNYNDTQVTRGSVEKKQEKLKIKHNFQIE
jgi:hypothetical protein